MISTTPSRIRSTTPRSRRAIADTQSESKIGFNVGGDVAYFFSRQVGIGVTAQYAGATVEMTVPSGTADVMAGGGQIGGGLRLRF